MSEPLNREVNTDDLPEIEEVETDEIEQEEVEIEEVETEEGEEDQPEMVMVEFVDDDGNVYEVPEALQSSLMKNKDYTQKSQANAQKAKELEEARAAWEAEKKRDEDDMKIDAELYSVQSELKKYENVDWDQLQDNDPDSATRHWRNAEMLRRRVDDLSRQKAARNQERSQSAQLALSKRVEETQNWAVQNIPNWNDQTIAELKNHAVNLGFTDEELQRQISPKFMQLLYNSYTGQTLKAAAAKPKAKANAQVQPLQKVKAKSGKTTRKDPDEMSMAEYRKWRNRKAG